MRPSAAVKKNCHSPDHEGGGRCMIHNLWSTLNAKMIKYLGSVSLKNFLEQKYAQQYT